MGVPENDYRDKERARLFWPVFHRILNGGLGREEIIEMLTELDNRYPMDYPESFGYARDELLKYYSSVKEPFKDRKAKKPPNLP